MSPGIKRMFKGLQVARNILTAKYSGTHHTTGRLKKIAAISVFFSQAEENKYQMTKSKHSLFTIPVLFDFLWVFCHPMTLKITLHQSHLNFLKFELTHQHGNL